LSRHYLPALIPSRCRGTLLLDGHRSRLSLLFSAYFGLVLLVRVLLREFCSISSSNSEPLSSFLRAAVLFTSRMDVSLLSWPVPRLEIPYSYPATNLCNLEVISNVFVESTSGLGVMKSSRLSGRVAHDKIDDSESADFKNDLSYGESYGS
jgi:hypothetical protein